MNIRDVLSARLKSEFDRKGTNPTRISNQTKQPIEVVEGYLKGNREIKFDELRPICESLKVSLMRLVSPNYKASQLLFRAVADQDLATISQIENAFLTIGCILPKTKTIAVQKLNTSDNDPAMLQAEINSALTSLRQTYPKVEDLYIQTGLSILPISAGENGFDAFIMNADKYSVVCVNRDKPPARIHFSLLHEMAHFLWHRQQNIPVDISIFDQFGNNIDKANIPEYVANKFAQQYLFPLSVMETLALNWKKIPGIAEMIAERRTTPDVLAFAIYDYLKLSSKPVNFEQIRNELKELAGIGWGRDKTILDFIEQKGNELKSIIYKSREEFSDIVWPEIKVAWELEFD